MGNLAVIFGRFLGAALAECAPVLVEILSNAIRQGFADQVEDGARRDDLRNRLLERVRQSNVARSSGGTGADSGDGQEREGLGGRPERE